MKRKYRMIPVAAIEPGVNPRVFNAKDPDFLDLKNSIDAAGVIAPIHVRATPPGDPPMRSVTSFELLAGERRWRACVALGRKEIPVLDYGDLDDEAAFDITFIENGWRKDLKPIEAGRAAAMLLDRYREDVSRAAARMGQTPHWLIQHAQVDRGLSDKWKAAAVTSGRFIPWSVSHWIEIARLAPSIQARLFKHCQGGNAYNAPHWTVDDLKRRLTAERRLLAQATFPTAGCADCTRRTGHQPLLWEEKVERASGDKDKCLDPACWDRKARKAAQGQFQKIASQAGYECSAVPLSMMAPLKTDTWQDRADYKAKLAPVRKTFGKALLEASNVTIVKKPTGWDLDEPGARDQGIVPAIVVAGRGKGSIKWVKPAEKVDASSGTVVRDARAEQRQDEEFQEQARRRDVENQVITKILAAPTPPLAVAGLLRTFLEYGPLYDVLERRFAEAREMRVDDVVFAAWAAEQIWSDVTGCLSGNYCPFEFDELQGLVDLVGVSLDVQGLYNRLLAEEKAAAQQAEKEEVKQAKTAKKTTKKSKKPTAA